MIHLFVYAFLGLTISQRVNAAPPVLTVAPLENLAEDPYLDKQWYLGNARVFNAWGTTQGRPATVVAVVDSGIQYNHPDLNPNLKRKEVEAPANGYDDDKNGFTDDVIGWDFVRNSYLPTDGSGHGTFMASIIASRRGNGVGIAGICPLCSLLPVRFLNSSGAGDNDDGVKAIRYAADEGAKVINISTAGEGYDAQWEKAIAYAGSKDAVVIVSSGNSEQNLDYEPLYPANFKFSHMLTVSASTPQDGLMEGSSWGKKTVGLLAPGEDIFGIDGDSYDAGCGTSQAAAVASGVAALVRSANPRLTASQTVQILRGTVRRVAGLEKYTQTGGIIDADAAVKKALTY